MHLLPLTTAHHLQLQLNQFHTFTAVIGLTLNAHKIKIMAIFCFNPPVFCYNGTPHENVQKFKYLGMIPRHNRRMTNAWNKMACNFAGAIARVWRICSELASKIRKHAMLWIFQAFALLAGLYACQFWATSTLTFESSTTTKSHIQHICFLEMLLGVKRSTNTHCLLR